MTRKQEIIDTVLKEIEELKRDLEQEEATVRQRYEQDPDGMFDDDFDMDEIDDIDLEAETESNGITFNIRLESDPYMGGIEVKLRAEYTDKESGMTETEDTGTSLDTKEISEAVERLIASVTLWEDKDINSNIGMNPVEKPEKPKHEPERFDMKKRARPMSIGAGVIEATENHRSGDKNFFEYLEEAGFDYLIPPSLKNRENAGISHDGTYDIETEDKYSEIKDIFDRTDITDEELLYETPWGCLGITAKQFHKIDSSTLNMETIRAFTRILTGEKYKEVVPEVLSRIHLATVIANVWDYHIQDKEGIGYIHRITKKLDINDAVMLVMKYQDYLKARPEAIAYNDTYIRGAENPEHGYYEYEKYPKPNRIQDLHDKANRDAVQYKNKEKEEEREEQNIRIADLNRTPDYQRFLYRTKEYSVIPVKSVEELIKEGEYLHHCIGTYGEKFASGESYLYFLRKNTEIDVPFYSAEIIVSPNNNVLTQLYTFYDSIEKTDEFRKFVLSWCQEAGIYSRCTI